METASFHSSERSLSQPSWIAVPDWPAYEVSDDGEVRRRGRVIAQRCQRNGYWRVTLSDKPGGRRKTVMVHRIVALAHISPAPSPRHQVDHIDGDKANNRRRNLRWVTPRENRNDGRSAVGSLNGAAVLTEDKVRYIRHLYDSSLVSVEEIAAAFDVSRQTITKIGRRRAWLHI